MDTQLPQWLSPPSTPPPSEIVTAPFDLEGIERYPRTKEQIELLEMTYSNLFEHVLDAVSGGRSLAGLIHNDPRNIEYGRFLRWVKKSKARQARYNEAKQIAAEILIGQAMSIVDEHIDEATGLPNDPVWAKMRIENRWKTAAAWNKAEYGDRKHVEMQIGALSEDELSKMSSDDLKRLIVEGEYDTENLLEG
jgi:N-acyl-L-homoserine lactone synthetase